MPPSSPSYVMLLLPACRPPACLLCRQSRLGPPRGAADPIRIDSNGLDFRNQLAASCLGRTNTPRADFAATVLPGERRGKQGYFSSVPGDACGLVGSCPESTLLSLFLSLERDRSLSSRNYAHMPALLAKAAPLCSLVFLFSPLWSSRSPENQRQQDGEGRGDGGGGGVVRSFVVFVLVRCRLLSLPA